MSLCIAPFISANASEVNRGGLRFGSGVDDDDDDDVVVVCGVVVVVVVVIVVAVAADDVVVVAGVDVDVAEFANAVALAAQYAFMCSITKAPTNNSAKSTKSMPNTSRFGINTTQNAFHNNRAVMFRACLRLIARPDKIETRIDVHVCRVLRKSANTTRIVTAR